MPPRESMATLREELAEVRAELAILRADFAAQVNRMVELVLVAKHVAPGASFADCGTDAEIRARAVAHVLGYDKIDDKSPDVIWAIFDDLAQRAGQDPVLAALVQQRGAVRH